MKTLLYIKEKFTYKQTIALNAFVTILIVLYAEGLFPANDSQKGFLIIYVILAFLGMTYVGLDLRLLQDDVPYERKRLKMTDSIFGVATFAVITSSAPMYLIETLSIKPYNIVFQLIALPLFIYSAYIVILDYTQKQKLKSDTKFADVIGHEEEKFKKYFNLINEQNEFYSNEVVKISPSRQKLTSLRESTSTILTFMRFIDEFKEKKYRKELIALTNSLLKVSHSKLMLINDIIKEPAFNKVLSESQENYERLDSTYSVILTDIQKLTDIYTEVDEENKKAKVNQMFEWL